MQAQCCASAFDCRRIDWKSSVKHWLSDRKLATLCCLNSRALPACLQGGVLVRLPVTTTAFVERRHIA